MRADWTVDRENGTTLVAVTLAADLPRRVRIEAAGDGPVWPPRERGVPEPGWDDAGWEGVVDGRRALGYATPAAADPPVRVEWGAPVEEPPAFEGHPDVPSTEPTPDGVVRTFGRVGPPREAVPVPDPDGSADANGPAAGPAASPERRESPQVGTVGRIRADGGPATVAGTRREPERGADAAPGGVGTPAPEPPPDDADGFEAVERRVATGEALAAADDLAELSAAVEAAGGLEGVRSLVARLDRDRERLRATERRAARLRTRLAAFDVPVERLERLA